MEGTAAISLYPGGNATLAERVKAYLKAHHLNVTDLEREISYKRPTISQYLSGTYGSNPTKIEAELTSFLNRHAEEERGPESRPLKLPRFFETGDARAVLGVCQSCQEYGAPGIIYGPSGFGKTYTLKYYARLPRVIYIESDVTMCARDLLKELEQALGLPRKGGTNHERIKAILDFLRVNRGYLLIFDEADKLINRHTQNKMEILRALCDHCDNGYDQAPFGLVIAGEPNLEIMLRNYDERMANRMFYRAVLTGMTEAEVAGYLKGYAVEPGALAELINRARGTRAGCFRLLNRTMRNVFRILEAYGENEITLNAITQASEMMML